MREGTAGFVAVDTSLAARIAWVNTYIMALMFMLGIDYGGEAGGSWGSGKVGAGAVKAGFEETIGEVCSHCCRGECLRESDINIMLVGRGSL